MSPRYVKVLLKARPTPAQLADRVASPTPDGIELYLDARDIEGDRWQERLAEIVRRDAPANFDFVVEGPLRALDGAFFDVTKPSAANRQVIDRLVSVSAAIGARATVIHAMAARDSAGSFDSASHEAALRDAVPLFSYYTDACLKAGLVPTVENVPPVSRMRERSLRYSLVGVAPADIRHLVEAVPGLKVTIDVSHAQLYVNAFVADICSVDAGLRPMVDYLQALPGVASVADYIQVVSGALFEAHISNARGLLGEGLPYDDGDLAMDDTIRQLSRHVRFLVTEIIEAEPDRAVGMREAQRRIMRALGRPLEGVCDVA